MEIREIASEELSQLLILYSYLHDNAIPVADSAIETLWHGIINDPNHHILVGVAGNMIVSSCVLLIVPNLTHNQRPYALIENVITHPKYRGKGYATHVLNFAKEISVNCCCYKIMLMTGSKQDATLNFYERAGYNKDDKTAFIQWLK